MSALDFGKMLAAHRQAASKPADNDTITHDELKELLTPNTEANLEARFAIASANVKVSGPQPLSNADQILGMITNLQQQLQTSAPGYESLLHKIHRALATDEDLVHLLSEEQIGTIVAGLMKRKNIVINTEKAKSGGKGGPRVTVDDL
jgi:hypothetical protein